jgi:type IV pilus assembly protein PilQ
MAKWIKTKAAGLLFAAAAAVYSDGLVRAMAASSADPDAPRSPADAIRARAASKSADLADKANARAAATNNYTKPAAAASKPAADKAVDKTTAAAKTDEAEKPIDPFADAPTPVGAPTPVVSANAAEPLTQANVNVSDAGLVEIHVNDANLGEVLRMLSLQLERNIMASKEVRGTVTANLYDVTVKEALEAILRANECGYREKGNVIYVYTKKELEQIEKDERKQVTETFRVFYTPAANAVNMIKPVLSPEAQVSFTTPAVAGIQADSKDVGGNSHATEDTLVVTDFPERLDQVRKVLKEIDRRPQQILVEAVILRATLNETNQFGVDFTILSGVDFNGLTNIGGAIAGNTPTGAMADKHTASLEAGGGGLKVGVITNNVSVFVQALEGVTDTAVLANPKVLVLNKQPGSVHVGARLGYRTAVSTETLTADDVKFLEIGTSLNFRPYIGDDGYIRMEINPKDSSGAVDQSGLPSEFVTEVTSNIMVRDGRTIVIGGMFRESSTADRSQTPGLGNLPIAGPLFRRQKDSTVREEVIVLLTPHIIKDEEAYTAASEEEKRQTERLRVGVRRGMMPWGRERLAESAYEHAVAELKKPNADRKKALWHLDCATNLNPKFSEAIKLKAQLTGEEVTSADNSTIRSFVERQTLLDRSRPTTVPSSVPISAAAPAVQPATQPVMKPVAPAAAAAAAPVAPVAAPATQPVNEPAAVETAEATTQPTTQPAVAEQSESADDSKPAVAETDAAEAVDEDLAAIEADVKSELSE